MPDEFDVFLSHNRRDQPVVEQIGAKLRARGLRVWLDKWELRPGFPWQEGLEAAVQRSRAVAVFVGADGLGAWQEPEMRAFIARSRREEVPAGPLEGGLPHRPRAPKPAPTPVCGGPRYTLPRPSARPGVEERDCPAKP